MSANSSEGTWYGRWRCCFDLVAFICAALAVFGSGGIDASHFKIVQPAQLGFPPGLFDNTAARAPAPGCSQATALLGRMDGSQNTSAVTNLICGMVADGNWNTVLDFFYIFAINSTANANLNWISTSFPITNAGTGVTFTAGQGYTGVASSSNYLQSAYNPSTAGGNMTQNSASLGACNYNSATSLAQQYRIVIDDNTNFSNLEPNGGGLFVDLQDATFVSVVPANFQGQWITTRTSSTNINVYQNGASVGSKTATSVTNINGALTVLYLGTVKLGAIFGGGTLTGTQASQIYNRLHTYFTAVGAPSGCWLFIVIPMWRRRFAASGGLDDGLGLQLRLGVVSLT